MQVSIVYFSGTGGTEMTANELSRAFTKNNIRNHLIPLSKPLYKKEFDPTQNPDLGEISLLVFPVYAGEAPWPVYKWIQDLEGSGKTIGIISVSGGGNAGINLPCREIACRKLEKKGVNIVFETMLVMPSNFILPAHPDLAYRILKALPGKCDKAVYNFLNALNLGKSRYRGKMPNPFMRLLAKCEQTIGKKFAKSYKVNDNCTGCGWCVKNCPTGNIDLNESSNKPDFAKQCTICMRCIYGCPFNAIRSWIPAVFKTGFDLKKVVYGFEEKEPLPLEECGKGSLWKAVVDYLKE